MNVRKIKSMKALKFLGLLISAMIIATVSAQVYNYMYLNATIGVEGATLQWIAGADATLAGTQIAGATATLTNLKGWTNATRIYPDPLELKNIAGSAVTFDLLIDDVSGGTGQMDLIVVRIYSLNTTLNINNMTVWDDPSGKGSDLIGLSIPVNNVWRFQWEITWKSTATTETVIVNLKVRTA